MAAQVKVKTEPGEVPDKVIELRVISDIERTCIRCGKMYFKSQNTHGSCNWHTTPSMIAETIRMLGSGNVYTPFGMDNEPVTNEEILWLEKQYPCGITKRGTHACCDRKIGDPHGGCWVGRHSDYSMMPDRFFVTNPNAIPSVWTQDSRLGADINHMYQNSLNSTKQTDGDLFACGIIINASLGYVFKDNLVGSIEENEAFAKKLFKDKLSGDAIDEENAFTMAHIPVYMVSGGSNTRVSYDTVFDAVDEISSLQSVVAIDKSTKNVLYEHLKSATKISSRGYPFDLLTFFVDISKFPDIPILQNVSIYEITKNISELYGTQIIKEAARMGLFQTKKGIDITLREAIALLLYYFAENNMFGKQSKNMLYVIKAYDIICSGTHPESNVIMNLKAKQGAKITFEEGKPKINERLITILSMPHGIKAIESGKFDMLKTPGKTQHLIAALNYVIAKEQIQDRGIDNLVKVNVSDIRMAMEYSITIEQEERQLKESPKTIKRTESSSNILLEIQKRGVVGILKGNGFQKVTDVGFEMKNNEEDYSDTAQEITFTIENKNYIPGDTIKSLDTLRRDETNPDKIVEVGKEIIKTIVNAITKEIKQYIESGVYTEYEKSTGSIKLQGLKDCLSVNRGSQCNKILISVHGEITKFCIGKIEEMTKKTQENINAKSVKNLKESMNVRDILDVFRPVALEIMNIPSNPSVIFKKASIDTNFIEAVKNTLGIGGKKDDHTRSVKYKQAKIASDVEKYNTIISKVKELIEESKWVK